MFQLSCVKVRMAGETVPRVGSLEWRGMVTHFAGWDASTTVNVAGPPPSETVSPELGLTSIPAATSKVTSVVVYEGLSDRWLPRFRPVSWGKVPVTLPGGVVCRMENG